MKLTLACGLYDRTLPLLDGSVRPEGIEVEFVPMGGHELFRRQARSAEFDVAEMSLSTYSILVSRGDTRMVGLPIFPSRIFRHGYVWVNLRSGIDTPRDLAGKRFGVMEYQQTAAVWIRAFLQHDYGVHPRDVEWHVGGYNQPEPYEERVPLKLPQEIRISNIGPERSLSDMLDSGDLDALMGAFPPEPFLSGSPAVRRLFPDFPRVEMEYFRSTSFFPIMHLVVMQRSIFERKPWLAMALYDVFQQSKAEGLRRLKTSNVLHASLPWLHAHLAETEALMGEDPFAYGFVRNQEQLATFLGYCYEQGLLAREVRAEELFVPELLRV